MIIEAPHERCQQWFARHIQPRCEKFVASTAQQKGLEQFLSLPGYLFCQTDRRWERSALVVPGALHLVGAGRTRALSVTGRLLPFKLPLDPVWKRRRGPMWKRGNG
jgi:hypothetical protein